MIWVSRSLFWVHLHDVRYYFPSYKLLQCINACLMLVPTYLSAQMRSRRKKESRFGKCSSKMQNAQFRDNWHNLCNHGTSKRIKNYKITINRLLKRPQCKETNIQNKNRIKLKKIFFLEKSKIHAEKFDGWFRALKRKNLTTKCVGSPNFLPVNIWKNFALKGYGAH